MPRVRATARKATVTEPKTKFQLPKGRPLKRVTEASPAEPEVKQSSENDDSYQHMKELEIKKIDQEAAEKKARLDEALKKTIEETANKKREAEERIARQKHADQEKKKRIEAKKERGRKYRALWNHMRKTKLTPAYLKRLAEASAFVTSFNHTFVEIRSKIPSVGEFKVPWHNELLASFERENAWDDDCPSNNEFPVWTLDLLECWYNKGGYRDCAFRICVCPIQRKLFVFVDGHVKVSFVNVLPGNVIPKLKQVMEKFHAKHELTNEDPRDNSDYSFWHDQPQPLPDSIELDFFDDKEEDDVAYIEDKDREDSPSE